MKISGTYFAIFAAALIGASIVFSAEATKQMNPVAFAFVTLLLSVVFLVPLSFVIREKLKLKEILGKNSRNTFASIFLRTVFGNIFLYLGFSLTSAVKAVFLLGFEPAFVVIASVIFLKEKLSSKQIILIIILIIGAFLLSTNGRLDIFSTAQLGDLFVVIAVFLFACSYIPAQDVVKKTNSTTLAIFSNLVGGLILIPVAFTIFNVQSLNLNSSVIPLIFANTILFSVFALFCFYTALKTTKKWIVSSLLQLAPIPGAIIAYIWLGDTLNFVQLVGAGIILVSSYLIAREH
jgi:drug/metabolite transporter (DMT)-like permease